MRAHSQEWSSLRLQFLGWPSSKLPLCPSSDSTLLVSKVLTGYFNSLMTKLTRKNAQSKSLACFIGVSGEIFNAEGCSVQYS